MSAWWESFKRAFYVPPRMEQRQVDVTAPTVADIPRALVTGGTRSPNVTVNESLGLASVYRAVSILCTLASSLDIEAVRSGRPVLTQPALIKKPNINEPRRVTIYQTVCSLALYGEAFWYLQRNNPLEVPNSIEVVPPNSIQIRQDQNGRVVYEIRTLDGKLRQLANYQIHHLKLMRIPGQLRGLGPIQAARSTVRGALDLEEYAGNWWNTNEVPEGALTTEDDLGPEQAKKYADMWAEARRQRRTAVLGKGLRYSPLSLSPKDALWIEAAQFNTVQIARMFGVPATILDAPSGDSATYANQRDKHQAMLDFTLRQYLDEIEDAFGELLPLGTFARFKTDELLRLDEAARYSAYATAIAAGVLTADECRAREGLDPIEQEKPSDEFNGGPDA